MAGAGAGAISSSSLAPPPPLPLSEDGVPVATNCEGSLSLSRHLLLGLIHFGGNERADMNLIVTQLHISTAKSAP